MINKFVSSVSEALADTPDGATVMIGGFGTAGIPDELIEALLAQGARDLTLVNNNAGNAEQGLAALLKAGRVRKVICSFPRQTDSYSNRESKCSYQNDFSFTPCMKIWGAIFPNHHSTILPQISSSD